MLLKLFNVAVGFLREKYLIRLVNLLGFYNSLIC